jgi:hypothetical protein
MIVRALVIGPVPTVVNCLVTPVVKLYVAVRPCFFSRSITGSTAFHDPDDDTTTLDTNNTEGNTISTLDTSKISYITSGTPELGTGSVDKDLNSQLPLSKKTTTDDDKRKTKGVEKKIKTQRVVKEEDAKSQSRVVDAALIEDKARVVGGVRHRLKPGKISEGEKDDREKRALLGLAAAGDADRATQRALAEVVAKDGVVGAPGLRLDELTLVANLSRRPAVRKRLDLQRSFAAGTVRFELLLALSKPIVPLACLIATGEPLQGVVSSIVVSQILHRIPELKPETQHVLVLLAGLGHSFLATQQLHGHKEVEFVHLFWSWSLRDVVLLCILMILGATQNTQAVASDPGYCVSFSAGLALRIMLHEAAPAGAQRHLSGLLQALRLVIDNADDVITRALNGIGDCAGGPFRMLWGGYDDERLVGLAVLIVKAFLLILPLLAATHWWMQLREAKKPGRRAGPALMLMVVASTLLCLFLISFQMNATNGSLANFWVASLIACVLEAFLSTYDIRGAPRTVMYYILFILL